MSVLAPALGPTPRQLRVMAAYVQTGSQKGAARECGIALRTVKVHMQGLYGRLGVGGVLEAATKLGWIAVPGAGPTPCGWVGYCSRVHGHRGSHGGMRSFVPPIDEGRRPVTDVDLSIHPAKCGFAASVQHGQAAALTPVSA